MAVSGVAAMSAGVFQGLNVQTHGAMLRLPMYPNSLPSTAALSATKTYGGVPAKALLPR
jgi:hypothetical protein